MTKSKMSFHTGGGSDCICFKSLYSLNVAGVGFCIAPKKKSKCCFAENAENARQKCSQPHKTSSSIPTGKTG